MTAIHMLRAATRSALLFAAVTGCSEIVEFGDGSLENVPSFEFDPGQFSFRVTARDWTYDNNFSPSLGAGTLNVGMAITGYSGGDGLVTITDADNVVVFNQTLAGNVANGTNVTVSGKAEFKVHIVANDYTGNVSLAVNATPGS